MFLPAELSSKPEWRHGEKQIHVLMFHYKLYLGFKLIVLLCFLSLWPIVATKWLLWWTAIWRKPFLRAVPYRSSQACGGPDITSQTTKKQESADQINKWEKKIVSTEQKPQSREHNSSNVYQEGSMSYFYDAFSKFTTNFMCLSPNGCPSNQRWYFDLLRLRLPSLCWLMFSLL